jgi:hypothetical protein
LDPVEYKEFKVREGLLVKREQQVYLDHKEYLALLEKEAQLGHAV